VRAEKTASTVKVLRKLVSELDGLTRMACDELPKKSKDDFCANGKTWEERGTRLAGSGGSVGRRSFGLLAPAVMPPITYMTPPRSTMRWKARGGMLPALAHLSSDFSRSSHTLPTCQR
jgi:hypothetical protein